MSSIALYYPWMHFQDEDWLKLALLSWNNIVRVRPPGVEDRDSDLVRQVCAGADLILDKSPSRQELDDVADVFCAVLDQVAAGAGTSVPSGEWGEWDRLYDARPLVASARETRPELVPFRMPDSQLPRGADEDLFWVHCGAPGKMSFQLRCALVDAQLAVEGSGSEPWWACTRGWVRRTWRRSPT